MDVVDILRCFVRRWWLTFPALALVVLGTWTTYQRALPVRSTSAVLLFVGPSVDVRFDGVSEVEVPQNPLVNTAGTQIAALVTSQSLGGDDTAGRLRQAGLEVDYEAGVDNRNPLVSISASSTVPGDAVRAIEILVQTAREHLAARQDAVGAPVRSRLDVQVLRMSQTESVSHMGRIRSAAVVAVVGVAMTTAAAAALEGLARWRGRVASRRQPTAPRAADARSVAEGATQATQAGPDGGPRSDSHPTVEASEPVLVQEDRAEVGIR